ncbi:MAG: CDP-2,3-bis-(O-geranylgeranyl)-sn-glycerol synthase [Theionarchaea archaeon]|nr:CDP-2,3-bis-(O-geranylgeranyl)-sn-glycerol synthase [Theionarchaea archaeon]MBU7022232.1 CDP-2,3-bis-(O-geranylgeranyl)-sn-glycerol synthase [Theionarchaea archaeon]MBU7035114.1 CDP-2,3-bis-(O-geranylgeranyl)-sn-glycerol synthase [Theionarchaea archaeon]MBU7040248.1 CDP-2,3-bis-(O-geranylgeranyl)-sn-glycerol synthase [Theionarchaea archaeon]
MVLEEIFNAVWFILPAWIGNMLACTFGGGKPIDGGRTFVDGYPILGKGKTIRGLAVGVLSAIIVASLQSAARYTFNPIIFGFLMGLGAMLGDMVKSFFKRRLNIQSGRPLPVFDQLDFVAGALVMYYLFGPHVLDNFYPLSWTTIATIVILTPAAHLSLNVLGYKLGLKDVWW